MKNSYNLQIEQNQTKTSRNQSIDHKLMKNQDKARVLLHETFIISKSNTNNHEIKQNTNRFTLSKLLTLIDHDDDDDFVTSYNLRNKIKLTPAEIDQSTIN